ncbi:MAG: hypothetical protein LAO30_07305 [Acidobacteriia bacterium]|nr:hypothetical protein [Terriglobia bacterium]
MKEQLGSATLAVAILLIVVVLVLPLAIFFRLLLTRVLLLAAMLALFMLTLFMLPGVSTLLTLSGLATVLASFLHIARHETSLTKRELSRAFEILLTSSLSCANGSQGWVLPFARALQST